MLAGDWCHRQQKKGPSTLVPGPRASRSVDPYVISSTVARTPVDSLTRQRACAVQQTVSTPNTVWWTHSRLCVKGIAYECMSICIYTHVCIQSVCCVCMSVVGWWVSSRVSKSAQWRGVLLMNGPHTQDRARQPLQPALTLIRRRYPGPV